MKIIGWILVIVGFGWALIGGSNIWDFLSRFVDGKMSSGWGAFGLFLTILICIVPGSVVGGLGTVLIAVSRRRKKSQKEEEGMGFNKCPPCAEEVKTEATISRFRRYEFPQPERILEGAAIKGFPCEDPRGLTLEESVFQEGKAPNGLPTDVQAVQDKLELLKMKYAGLSRKIRVSNDEFEREELKLEQSDVSAEMEKCRLAILRSK
jgi:hypothetical protein